MGEASLAFIFRKLSPAPCTVFLHHVLGLAFAINSPLTVCRTDQYIARRHRWRLQWTVPQMEAAISRQESLGHYWVLEGGPWLELPVCWHSVPIFTTRWC
jgi:hypothetical protein